MFKTILAYVLVIALGQFAFTIGTLLGSGLFGALLYYLPVKIKLPIAGTLAGVLARITVMAFAYGVFWLLTGHFGGYSFIAATVSMIIPLNTDFATYQGRKRSVKETDWGTGSVGDEARAMVAGEVGGLVGVFIGIGLCALYFFR
jgi:hypothetical protein